MPMVTIVWLLYPGGTSSRAYAISKVVDLPNGPPVAGTTLDVLPGDPVFDGRKFVVEAISADDRVMSKRVILPDPDKLEDLVMRARLQRDGWTVGFDGDEEQDHD
ncbi:MAG: hypothetical protein IAG13_02630 [Deltaproteobacteria bacterium]|nr:hypothetical protein [Nannocystaceae bacterium]